MLYQGLESTKSALKKIRLYCVAEDSRWNVDLGGSVAGNCTIDSLISEIQCNIDTKNENSHSYFLVEAPGYRYEDGDIDQKEEDWKIAETCNLWKLTRYEVYSGVNQTYEAIFILYYEPFKSEVNR